MAIQSRFGTSICCIAAALGLMCASTANISAADRLISGQWEFTMTTDGATRKLNQCITPEKARESNGDSTSGRDYAEKGAKGRCKVNSYNAAGDTVSYSLMCDDRQLDSVTVFHGDSSEGSLITTTAGKSVKTIVKARRLGACP